VSSQQIIVTPQLLNKIEESSDAEQAQWLFLVQSTEFKGYWEVHGLNQSFFLDLADLIGPFRLVSPVTITEFMAEAGEWGYQVAFMEDPADILVAYEYLKEKPDISLRSTLEGNVQGFLPWQITGYNKLIRNEEIRAGFFVWATGSGKTAAMASAIKHHQMGEHRFNLAFCVVKSHNKIDTQRKLKSLGDIDSIIVDGSKKQRQKIYQMVEDQSQADSSIVLILNYEKIREDYEDMIPLVTDANCLFFWDEAPTKLANRGTQLYKATKKLLYKTFPSKPRAKWMRHWALTATPIENSPEDLYSVGNLMKPGILGTLREFYDNYGENVNFFTGKYDTWKNLEGLEARIQFMTHRVSKDDPQVKAKFPNVVPHPLTIDWNPKHFSIYNNLTGKAKDLLEDDLESVNILALIQIMQMMCDAPSMIATSADNRKVFYDMVSRIDDGGLLPPARGSDIALMLIELLGVDKFTNVGHSKLDTWGDIIINKHPTEKIVTHSTWSEYIFPIWEEYLSHHNVSYVVYSGNSKDKQIALDEFRTNPEIRCFLSGDAGADSIDISEASVGINYNIPWKWTTLQQREGRRDRVNSLHKQIHTYTLTMPFSVDERKLDICNRKYAYHEQLFDGKAQDEAISASLTYEELTYLMFG
jgi:SNF2 family DNA or RNA helicase